MSGYKNSSCRKALIVANGGSVDIPGRDFWKRVDKSGVMMVGTNRALCFDVFEEFKPHVMVIRDTFRSLWQDQKFGELYHEKYWKPFCGWKVGPAERRYTFCDEYVVQRSGWQEQRRLSGDGESFVMKNITVALMAANWAWLAGARELFFLGVDYFGRHANMKTPFGGAGVGWQGQYKKPVPDMVERQFSQAVCAVESAGGTMLNLSGKSKICSIEKADFERLFK